MHPALDQAQHPPADGNGILSAGQESRWWRWAPLILIAAAVTPYLNAGRTVLFFDSLIMLEHVEYQEPAAAMDRIRATKFWPGQELTMLTLAANHRLNRAIGLPGFDPRGFVAVNVGVHAVNTMLLFFLIRSLMAAARFNDPTRGLMALLASILFAVHPLQASCVLYVVQRRDLLCTTFYLLTLLAWLRLRSAGTMRARAARLAAVALLGLLCIKSKATGVTLPLAVLAMELCLRAPDRASLRRLAYWTIPTLVMCLVVVFAYLVKYERFDLHTLKVIQSKTFEEVHFGPLHQALSQARATVEYWKLILLPRPSGLCIDHDFRPTLDAGDVRAWLVVGLHVLVLAVAVYAAWRRWTLVAFGVMLFYIALVAWIFLPQPVILAEYKAYLPSVGIAFILAEALHRLLHSFPQAACNGECHSSPLGKGWGMGMKLILVATCVLIFLILATITFSRNAVFSSSIAPWKDVVAKYPDHFRGQYNLANALFNERRFDEAVGHYREAIRLDDDNYRPHYNLANTLMRLGRRDEAIGEYLQTLRYQPTHAGARSALQGLGIRVEAAPRTPGS